MKGIDVAKWNGNIDWQKAKEDGVEFAVLKVINKQVKEEDAFARNYAGATAKGLPVGVYNYSYATTVDKAVLDAKKVVDVLAKRELQCKVWLDAEDKVQQGIGRTLIDIINEYKKIIEAAGYEFGVYTGLYFYNTYIKPYASSIKCPFWIARYPYSRKMQLTEEPPVAKKPAIAHDLWGWQYSSIGSVAGITGNVDLDIYYGEHVENRTYPILREGSIGDAVKELQQLLADAGYKCGAVDGVFGSKTLEAVKAYQKDHGLVVDGVVGPKTWGKLTE